MTKQEKNRILGRRWFLAKKRILKKIPKLLNNSKLAERRANPSPLESCINQSDDPKNCAVNGKQKR
jgi:hypothetical protein